MFVLIRCYSKILPLSYLSHLMQLSKITVRKRSKHTVYVFRCFSLKVNYIYIGSIYIRSIHQQFTCHYFILIFQIKISFYKINQDVTCLLAKLIIFSVCMTTRMKKIQFFALATTRGIDFNTQCLEGIK